MRCEWGENFLLASSDVYVYESRFGWIIRKLRMLLVCQMVVDGFHLAWPGVISSGMGVAG